MTATHQKISGTLVTLPLPGRTHRTLDGFWSTGKTRSRHLLIFVHGMGSNFYKSKLKKAWLTQGPLHGVDVLTFNNRGCEGDVASEDFRDCLTDIDAAMAYAKAEGYRRVTLLGHSTGCQKITYYVDRRKPLLVDALILAALGDDLAIARRDLGRAYMRWLNKAKRMVAQGEGEVRLPGKCLGFTARRFLSAVDPTQIEASLFHLDGPLRTFRRITLPILAVFPENEQYACIPVTEAAEKLQRVTRSSRFDSVIISEADHSFHGREEACVKACLRWMKELSRR